MNKITIDMSDFNNTSECELTFIKPNGVIVQFPKVYINNNGTCYNIKSHKEYCRDKNGAVLCQCATELIDEISGEFSFMPLIDNDGVQYRKIREVRHDKPRSD